MQEAIGSAPPASEREEHFADTAPVSPRKTPEQRTTGRKRALHTGEVVSAFAVMPTPSLLVTPRRRSSGCASSSSTTRSATCATACRSLQDLVGFLSEIHAAGVVICAAIIPRCGKASWPGRSIGSAAFGLEHPFGSVTPPSKSVTVRSGGLFPWKTCGFARRLQPQ
jgi:hypothetical protein